MVLPWLPEVELPVFQAPMAGVQGSALAIAVCEAGGLGSLPCAMLDAAAIRAEVGAIRARTERPFNLNFFCHAPPVPDAARDRAWRAALAPYYAELGLTADDTAGRGRRPFDDELAALVTELAPPVVSFHFGLPAEPLLARVRAAGARIFASATTVAEARWLAARGVDAIIAQGAEAGGHRGTFLAEAVDARGESRGWAPAEAVGGEGARPLSIDARSESRGRGPVGAAGGEGSGPLSIVEQVGTLALVPQIARATGLPVIAAGGIADAAGVRAVLALGAAAAQVGTSYLLCPEATTSPVHRAALVSDRAQRTVITNVFTGRPARGIVNRLIEELGPMSDLAPAFPLAAAALAPLRACAERAGSDAFSPLWAGQNTTGCRAIAAAQLTRALAGLV